MDITPRDSVGRVTSLMHFSAAVAAMNSFLALVAPSTAGGREWRTRSILFGSTAATDTLYAWMMTTEAAVNAVAGIAPNQPFYADALHGIERVPVARGAFMAGAVAQPWNAFGTGAAWGSLKVLANAAPTIITFPFRVTPGYALVVFNFTVNQALPGHNFFAEEF